MTSLISLRFGDVREKNIQTPNHFVTHMIEHIAWRMGLQIDLKTTSENWHELGCTLGEKIRLFPPTREKASALGMIDDGSAEVHIQRGASGVDLSAAESVDVNWFLSLRCEQLSSGAPLVELLNGLSAGLQAGIQVVVWNLEDPHHTWEGIFRGIGMALGKMYAPTEAFENAEREIREQSSVERYDGTAEVQVLERGLNSAAVRRGTAETGITIRLMLGNHRPTQCRLQVDESIRQCTDEAVDILNLFAAGLEATLDVDFIATKLSSSHVVMEDIGLVVGRTLLEIIKFRMESVGVQGAGSSLLELHPTDLEVGVSVEGRKFWRIVPKSGEFSQLKRGFLIGQTVRTGLRTEDLDDFLDGLSGGMSASIMVHLRDFSDPSASWQELFRKLGAATKDALSANPFRKGVPPGVKATLA